MDKSSPNAMRTVLTLAVPVVAALIAARQFYLSSNYGLSTWKGGGMGMFASTDSLQTRYAQVHLEFPDGTRLYVSKFAPHQDRLLRSALYYPLRENFARFARSLETTAFAANKTPSTVNMIDADGNSRGLAMREVYLARAETRQAVAGAAQWKVRIDYFNLDYDPRSRLLEARVMDTMTFEPGSEP